MSIFTRFSDSIRNIVNIDAHIDTDKADAAIRNNIEFRGPNAWILAIAIIIASVGLNVNSIPVIIGAMLISPLMGPIFGLGLGLGINDINLLKQAGKNLLIMVSISLGVSLLYFMITPLSLTDQSEILARTRPTIFDVMIALFGGLAGIFEQCRKEKGTVFSGVAIATALMPPLCTAGYGLATGQLSFFFGALYLFCINCIFITLATYFLVRYFKFKKSEVAESASAKKTQRITTIFIILFLVPSVWSAVTLVKENNFEQKASQFAENHRSFGQSIIYDYQIEHENGSVLKIFLTGESLDESSRNNLYASAKEYGISQDQLIIKEYITKNPQKDGEVFKGIYEKLDSEIEQYEATIEQLKKDLQSAQKSELPYMQIANEIVASHPSIKHIYMGMGAHIAVDSLQFSHSMLVTVQTYEAMDSISVDQLTKWVKVRLQVENVYINNQIIECPPVETADDETLEGEAESDTDDNPVSTPEE